MGSETIFIQGQNARRLIFADRSYKKQRIYVGTVHIYRLMPSVSIPFDEKLGNSCMNMYVVSQKSEAFFPAVLYGSVDVIQKGLGAPEHIQNLFHIETRIIIFS